MMHFDIEDRLSGSHFLRFTLSLESYGSLISGLADIEAMGDFGEKAPIGYRREHRAVIVPIDLTGVGSGENERQMAVAAQLAPYEVDGWRARASDALNHHRRVDDGRYTVAFIRYVHPETGVIWGQP